MQAQSWHYRYGYFLILLMIGLGACQPQADSPLPTLAQLPASSQIAETQAVITSVSAINTPDAVTGDTSRATLPSAWTATPSPSPTVTLSATITVTVTPSATITDTPSPTSLPPPTIDPQLRSLTSLIQAAAVATVLPTDFVVPAYQGTEIAMPTAMPPSIADTLQGVMPTMIPSGSLPPNQQPTCQFLPSGGFGTAFTSNPDIAAQIGCPTGNPPDVLSLPAAYQPFQQGLMLWISGDIYVLNSTTRTYQRYTDTFMEGTDPQTSNDAPPTGLVAPVRGFLKVWSVNAGVQSAIGWGIAPEQGTNATTQNFINGKMVWLPVRNDILVFIGGDSGTWRSVSGRF